ncbi:MAG: dTMP kinase [Candidatus Woesearchaeota archaeon]
MIITFEGGEFAGKGEQIGLLKSYLTYKGHRLSHINFYEPGGTQPGDILRAMLKGIADTPYAKQYLTIPAEQLVGIAKSLEPDTEMHLFLASRAMLYDIAKQELAQGKVIIWDRSVDSTAVYQGHVKAPDLLEDIRKANQQILERRGMNITQTFLLDIPYEVALERKKKRPQTEDKNDNMPPSFFEKVRQGYLAEHQYYRNLPENHPQYKRIVRIDGNRPIQVIHEDIVSRLNL